jgi:hypothetical protein
MPVWMGESVVMPDTVEVVDPVIVEDPTVVELDLTPIQTYSFACRPEQSVFTAGFQA